MPRSRSNSRHASFHAHAIPDISDMTHGVAQHGQNGSPRRGGDREPFAGRRGGSGSGDGSGHEVLIGSFHSQPPPAQEARRRMSRASSKAELRESMMGGRGGREPDDRSAAQVCCAVLCCAGTAVSTV